MHYKMIWINDLGSELMIRILILIDRKPSGNLLIDYQLFSLHVDLRDQLNDSEH